MKTSRAHKSHSASGDALPLPVLADEASLRTLRSQPGLLSRAWGWLQSRQVARNARRLRVAETVSLGEKRFVAVVQVDGRHFLLAGGPTNIVLLAQLDAKDAFEDVLKKTLTPPRKQVAKRKRPANPRQAQVNRTNGRGHVAQTTAPAPARQAAKRANSENGFRQGSGSMPPMTHLNGTENFGDMLQSTMSADRQPANSQAKQNSKSTAEKIGYYA